MLFLVAESAALIIRQIKICVIIFLLHKNDILYMNL